MVVPFVHVPLVNEIVVLDVVIQGWPFLPQRMMLLVDHANDRHVDQGNMHPWTFSLSAWGHSSTYLLGTIVTLLRLVR